MTRVGKSISMFIFVVFFWGFVGFGLFAAAPLARHHIAGILCGSIIAVIAAVSHNRRYNWATLAWHDLTPSILDVALPGLSLPVAVGFGVFVSKSQLVDILVGEAIKEFIMFVGLIVCLGFQAYVTVQYTRYTVATEQGR